MKASVVERHGAERNQGFRTMALLGLLLSGCMLATDAATRLGQEVVDNAAVLRREADVERTFVHQPRSWPEGCEGEYTVTFQESLHHPAGGGSLLIGCKGSPNFRRLGYNYGTTYHLNAVRVPKALTVDKPAGASLRLTLKKVGPVITVVGLE